MQKIICKKLYDTETASVVEKVTHGNFGDADGYEETLYLTPDGFYFLYVNGGAESIHPVEEIRRLSKANAEKWIEEHK